MICFLCFFCLFLTSCSSSNDTFFLDYAASAEINKEALSEFNRVSLINGNSSGINRHSKILAEIEKKSARIIAEKINAEPDQILFVNNATMATNIAILGVAARYPKCHFITSRIEHKGLLNVFRHLESTGCKVTYIDTDRFGNINLKQLEAAVRTDTKLISIQAFNSEIGVMQDIKSVGKIARKHGILFHSDASQAFCRYDIDVREIGLDLMTISGYKTGAPKGIAGLYIRDRSILKPILFGAGDELFPGTKPTALIASFASAVEKFRWNQKQTEANFRILVSELQKIKDVHINSPVPSHIVSVSIGGVMLNDLLENLKNYSFSSGCSCLGQDHSNVIKSIDPKGNLPPCTIRISFSDKVTSNDLIKFAQNLGDVVTGLRGEKKIEGAGCPLSGNEKAKNDLNILLREIKNLP
ncbi:MAG: aminotransferase class V-fold PLP-dependent enzyme [Holosporaceae bacterium]|nr:aminotransferase class V-fold PLP-dependent enzyme [Holosporaceae bacterium]